MDNSYSIQRVLIWLLIAAASIFLIERSVAFLALIATPLLLFGLAWLIALALRPLVDHLSDFGETLPFGLPAFSWMTRRRIAVTLSYLMLMAVIAIFFIALAPAIGPQLTALQAMLPSSVDDVAWWAAWLEQELSRAGLRIDLERVVQPEMIAQQITTIGSVIAQQALGIASSVAIITLDITFILILSFYMSLDGPQITARLFTILPATWRTDAASLLQVIDRSFGGFLRAQVLQGVLYGAATAIIMVIFKLNIVALVSLMSAVLILIPLIGGPIAVIPPLIVSLFINPPAFFPLLITLLIVQQILFNVITPRIMGQIVGLHPLLVFAAIFVGGALAGVWGALFGIPIAGVLASLAQFIYLRTTATTAPPPESTAEQAEEEALQAVE